MKNLSLFRNPGVSLTGQRGKHLSLSEEVHKLQFPAYGTSKPLPKTWTNYPGNQKAETCKYLERPWDAFSSNLRRPSRWPTDLFNWRHLLRLMFPYSYSFLTRRLVFDLLIGLLFKRLFKHIVRHIFQNYNAVAKNINFPVVDRMMQTNKSWRNRNHGQKRSWKKISYAIDTPMKHIEWEDPKL